MSSVQKPARWKQWVVGAGVGVGLLITLLLTRLDPWLRRTVERQVASLSGGLYQVQIGQLHTSLWQRAVRLQGIHLRPAPAEAAWCRHPGWPRVRADVAELRISGVGIWDLLRGQVVPVDTVQVTGAALRVLRVPLNGLADQSPDQYLPARLKGLQVRYFCLRDLRGDYSAGAVPRARVRHATLVATDVLLSRAGRNDSTRLAYARTLSLGFSGAAALARGHQLTVARGSFSSSRQRLTLDSVLVRPSGQRVKGRPVMALTLPQMQLTGIRLTGLRQRQIRLDSFLIESPRLVTTLPEVPVQSLHQLLAPYLRRVQLNSLLLRRGYVHVTGSPANPTVRSLTISATNLRVDAAGLRSPARVLYALAWDVRTGAVSGLADAPYYRVDCGSLHANTRLGLLDINAIRIIPTVTPAQLARRKGHQSPHLTVRVPQLRFAGLDYAALQRRRELLAREITVLRPHVQVAGDARFPLTQQASVVTPETLGHLPLRYNIRRLRVREGNLYTSYVAPKGGRGVINFNHLNATLTNLTNDPSRMTFRTPLVVWGTGRLQNQCPVRISIWAPLLDPRGTHWGEATFGAAPFAMLNSMTEPTRLIRFEKGRIRRIRLALRVNQYHAQGTMRAEYTGLKLALLTRRGGADNQNLVTKAGSKLLNGLLVRDNNPRRVGQSLKVGTMSSRRDPRFTVVVFWRQNLISGLLNSAGVPSKLAVTIGQQQ